MHLEKGLLAACKGEDTFLPCFLVDSFHEVKIYFSSIICPKVDGTLRKEGRGVERNGKKLRGKIGRGTEYSSDTSPPPSLPSTCTCVCACQFDSFWFILRKLQQHILWSYSCSYINTVATVYNTSTVSGFSIQYNRKQTRPCLQRIHFLFPQ